VVLPILPPGRLPPLMGLMMLTYFLLVGVIDVEHRLILGPISQIGIALGLLIGIYLHNILYTLIGGLAGAGIMWLLYLAGRLFSQFLSKRQGVPIDDEALGFGDVYVAAIIGLILGWPGITAGLLGAILLGGVISGLYLLVMLIAKRYHSNTALPYAPFLLLAVVLLLYYPK
jgi:leader peptidase (prepilin peptidase) / N-methyltransferase